MFVFEQTDQLFTCAIDILIVAQGFTSFSASFLGVNKIEVPKALKLQSFIRHFATNNERIIGFSCFELNPLFHGMKGARRWHPDVRPAVMDATNYGLCATFTRYHFLISQWKAFLIRELL